MRRVVALLLALPLIGPVPAAPSPTAATRHLTVKTEQRFPLGRASNVTTIATYFSGTRQRRETRTSGGLDERVHWVTITLCDENRTLILNPEAKLYAYMRHEVPAFRRLIQPILATPRPNPSGSKVIITIDAVDTGERREVGSYVARHVKTTTTESDGYSEKRVREQDGWYLDLPDMNCGRDGETTLVVIQHAGVHVQHRGTARRGYPIEETDRDDHGNVAITTKLIEFSEAPLEDELFTVPSGYRAALPLLAGYPDMTRPDTVRNRLESYAGDRPQTRASRA
jgi:hypothetical protein